MVRLPDIPIESWIADQQDLLNKKIGGLFPSLEFMDATNDAASQIPNDFPYIGGEDTFLQEQERIRQLQEEEDRRVEQERLQAEAQQRAQMEAASLAAMREQEMLRQQEMQIQAHQTASQLGIPLPEDVAAGFQRVTGPPGTGDNLSSSGAFDAETQQPASEYDFRFLEENQASPIPSTPPPMESVQDFNEYAGGLSQLADFDQQQQSPPDYGPSPVVEGVKNAASAVWDVGSRAVGAVGRGYQESMDAPLLETVRKGTAELRNAVADVTDESSISYEEARRAVEARRERMGLIGDAERILEYTQDLGFETVSGTLGSKIAGQLWKEFMPTEIAGVPTVFHIGDFEINPGEFIVPSAVGGGANARRIATQVGENTYGQFAAGAIERGTAAAAGKVGEGLRAGAAPVGRAIGEGLRAADSALGQGIEYGRELAGKVGDDLSAGMRSTFNLPDAAGEVDRASIAAKNIPLSQSIREGYRRLFHGGQVGNETIDPAQFNENGMFGPAHYLSTSPDVANHYFYLGGDGSVIRPTDVPDKAILFNAEKAVPQADMKKIASAMNRLYGDDPEMADLLQEYDMLANAPRGQYPQIPGTEFYNDLSRELTPPENWRSVAMDGVEDTIGDKRLVNELLSEAGFDGVYYRGEDTVRTTEGRMPSHSAVAIFPEALDNLRNGITGEMRGSQSLASGPGEAEYAALRSLPARSTVGGVTGAITGASSGDEDTPVGDRLSAGLVGAVAGSVGAQKGTIAAARLVDRLIAKGALNSDILSTHPITADRVRALFALAAKNLPDDEAVNTPAMVRYLTKADPDVRAEVESFINGPKTAGEIRQALAAEGPGLVQRVGREAEALLLDMLTGVGVRGARAAETRSDRASIEGITNLNPFRNMASEVPDSPRRIELDVGPAVRMLDDGPTGTLVGEIADDLGIPRPAVYVVDAETPGAWASAGSGKQGRMIALSNKLGQLDLDAEEMRALITHELAHTTEQSFGSELIGRAIGALDRSFGPAAEDLVGAVRTPRRGVWKERVENGPEIPEGSTPRQANEIQRQYDEAMRLLERSQTPRLKAKNQIRYLSMAHTAWEKYDAAVSSAKKALGTSQEAAPRTPARGRAPVLDREPGGVPEDDAFPFGRTASDTDVPEGPTPRTDLGESPAVGVPAVADDLGFDADVLPDQFNPSELVEAQDLGKLVGQLNEELAMDPKLQQQAIVNASKLMAMPKPRYRHLQSLIEKIGERRAVPRGMTREEAGKDWADTFFRKNGWLAPARVADETTVPPAITADDVATPRSNYWEPDAEDVAENARQEAQAVARGPHSGYLEESDDAALRELEGTSFDDIDELEDVPVEDMPGIIARRRVRKDLRDDPILSKDPGVQMFANPTNPKSTRHAGFFEQIHNHYREKWIPAVTDELAILQGLQNDVVREWKKQNPKIPLGPDVLAAEYKRLDAGRAAEMAVNDRLKPALQVFRRLELPMEQVNNYLTYRHQLDVAFEKGNLARSLPGGQDLAGAQQFVDDFERIYAAKLGAKNYKDFQQAIVQVDKFGEHLLDVKLTSGLINQDDYNAMRKAYPHYIPTRVMDYLNDENRVGMGKSLSVNDNLIREMTFQGTEKETVSPLAALLGDTYQTYAAAQKNRVFNSFLELVDAASMMTLPKTARGNRIQNMVDAVVRPSSASTATPIHSTGVTGFVGGYKTKIFIDKAIGDVTTFNAPTHIPILSGLMNAFRSGATARNPVFLTANMALDLSNYLIRETARDGGNPLAFGRVLAEYIDTAARHLPIGTMIGAGAGGYAGQQQVTPEDTMMTAAGKIAAGMGAGALMGHGVERALGNKSLQEIARHEYSGNMKRYLEEGGGTAGGFFDKAALPPEPTMIGTKNVNLDSILSSLGYRNKSKLEQGVDELQRGGAIEINNARDLWRTFKDMALLKPVERLGERIELVPRVAAMRRAEKRGESMVEAVNKGRTTTIDFNKGGTASRFINQFVPFFNVGMQGAADVGRAWSENPAAFSTAIATAVVGPVAFAEVWNNSTEQMKKDYADVPDYIKDQGLVVMLPGKATTDEKGNRHPQFFHFRYRNLAPFAMLTREFVKRTYVDPTSTEDRRGLVDLLLGGAEQMSPIGIGSTQEFTSSLLPPAIGTGLQLAFDRDTFRGTRIVSKQGDERASPLSKALAERFGGRASQWEFGTRDIGTGYAGMLHGASAILEDAPRTGKTSPQELPVTGGLYSRVIKGSIGGEAQRQTDEGSILIQSKLVTPSAEKLLKQNKITWRPAATDPEMYDMPLTRVEMGQYQKKLNQLTDEVIHEVLSDPDYRDLSSERKKEIIQRIIARRKRGIQAELLESIPERDFDRRRDTALAAEGSR